MTGDFKAKESSSQPSANEMAVLNTILALDRTLLAWVRTSITLVGFGFTLAKFVHELVSKNVLQGISPTYPRHVGFALMFLGLGTLIGGAFEYVTLGRKIHGQALRLSVSLAVTLVLLVLSVMLLMSILGELNNY